MKLVKLLVTGIFLLLSSALYATDFSGIWVGTATKSGENLYTVALELVYKGGTTYEGKCALGVLYDGANYRIGTVVKGTGGTGTKITFSDQSVVTSTQPKGTTYFWCTKSFTLYKSGEGLSGTITGTSPGGECVTVEVSLQKK